MNANHSTTPLQQYPILKNVLKFLNGRLLCLAAQVCTSWRKAVAIEIKHRRFWKSILLKKLNVTEEKTYIQSLHTKPSGTVVLYSRLSKVNTNQLSKLCSVITARCEGVIGPQNTNQISTEKHYEVGVSMLSMKDHAVGVNTTTFTFHAHELRSIEQENSSFFKSLGIDVNKCTNIVVFLLVSLSNNTVDDFVRSVEKEAAETNVVIIGGYCRISGATSRLSGFVLYGERLKSVLRIYDGCLEEELRDSCEEMKKQITGSANPLNRNSMMLMISCVERGSSIYQKDNVECNIINEVFPGLPVFGFFGMGEVASSSDKEWKTKHEHASLTFTSVFCLVSF